MRALLGIIFGAISAAAAIGMALAAFHGWAYRKGFGVGYDQGWNDADNWWIRAEEQVEEVRHQMWREKAEQ